MSIQSTEERGQWGSKLGFILAASGSAVGLGNIWRFPYMTGENGGAAFVFVYLCCVILIGLPLLINELALGRASGKNPVGAFKATIPGTPFVITGVLCVMLCFVVLSYYSVIAGWTIGYAISSVMGKTLVFSDFVANPMYILPLLAVFLILTALIVQAGVQKGIERAAKILMPLLLVFVLIIIARSVTLPGAMAGVKYYLKPDFSKINGEVALAALGQAFFSLSVGWGLMITYGSYMPKKQNMVSGGVWVAFTDTFVAILGGFMVFPAVFAFGMEPNAGPSLTFQTLPAVFEQMPAGGIVATIFFLLLAIAALTSSISMLEVPVSYLLDEKKASRSTAAWIVAGLAFLMGIPSALSAGGSKFFTEMELFGKTGFMDIVDFGFGTVLVVVISLLCSVYVGWVWGPKAAVLEISEGSPSFAGEGGGTLGKVWAFFVKFICPVVITYVLFKTFFPS
ncbi:sodium-dependent transporter [bacterium]|jgi:neurotransmitter:Na+ symporter, NSS family|nr:sodium-dependent transporter [bacterium]MDA7680353.1 sodium-dependent transporter [bacterium]